MWDGNNKVWIHFSKNIVASDGTSARFLADYLNYLHINRTFLDTIEILDLQRHKRITDKRKIKRTLKERMHIPFIFIASRN